MTISPTSLKPDQAGNRNPFFSVLVPTYNRADILPHAINSVLEQTFPDFEILVVGDGCTDGTSQVVQSYQDRRIRWFDFTKAPYFGYANRNKALQEAKGQYITFLGHDNLYLPNHLADFHTQILAHKNADILFSRPCWVNPEGAIFPTNYSLNNPSTYEDYVSRKGNHIPASCVVYRRTLHDKVGLWNDQLTGSGDYDLWVRILEKRGKEKMMFLEKITCLHFRANWRTDDIAGPKNLMSFEALYRNMTNIPSIYKFRKIHPGTTEQAYLFHEIIGNKHFSHELNYKLINLYDLLLAKAIEEMPAPAKRFDLDHSHYKTGNEYATFHIDTINHKRIQSRIITTENSIMEVSGWAIDLNNKSVASAVIIKINQICFGVDRYGLHRADVANHFDMPQLLYAGFFAKLDLQEFNGEEIKLEILVVSFDKKILYLPSPDKSLQIRLDVTTRN